MVWWMRPGRLRWEGHLVHAAITGLVKGRIEEGKLRFTMVYIYIHLHTFTYIYIHLHTFTYIYIHLHTFTYIYIHYHTLSYIYIYLHTLSYIIIHLHMCLSSCTGFPVNSPETTAMLRWNSTGQRNQSLSARRWSRKTEVAWQPWGRNDFLWPQNWSLR